jgi:ubiquinol-cytochrome c reductase cytochrome b subunit
MSVWGAQVIVNLFGTIPLIGPDLALWIRGDYVVGDATLNRFFALHVIAFPLVLLGLVVTHILALHDCRLEQSGRHRDQEAQGPSHRHPIDGIPFHPYYTVKDLVGAIVIPRDLLLDPVLHAGDGRVLPRDTTISSRQIR